MGKVHEKIVSSTTETRFQCIVIILPEDYIAYLEGLAWSKCSLRTGYLDNYLLQFKWAFKTSRRQLQEDSSSCLLHGQPNLTTRVKIVVVALGLSYTALCELFTLKHQEKDSYRSEGKGMEQASEREAGQGGARTLFLHGDSTFTTFSPPCHRLFFLL